MTLVKYIIEAAVGTSCDDFTGDLNYIPVHFTPSPLNPVGHGPHSAPIPGAGMSVHSTPSKQLSSVHPSSSSVQNLPVYAAHIRAIFCQKGKSAVSYTHLTLPTIYSV